MTRFGISNRFYNHHNPEFFRLMADYSAFFVRKTLVGIKFYTYFCQNGKDKEYLV